MSPMLHSISLPTPYPVGDVNVYFIDGKEPTLIDTGVYSSRSIAAIKEGLKRLGRDIGDLRRVLVTHCHFDHAGAAYELCRLSGATLFCHPLTRPLLSRRPDREEVVWDFLGRCGVPAETMTFWRDNYRKGDRFGKVEPEPEHCCPLKDGDAIEFDDGALVALETPGHCPDHLCFWHQESGLLVSGDMLLATITPNPLMYFNPGGRHERTKSLLQYMASLDAIEQRGPARAVPGHGVPIDDPASVIARNRGFIETRQERFKSSLASSGEAGVFELTQAHFGPMDPLNTYLCISETVAHLDLLEARGHALVDWEANRICAHSTGRSGNSGKMLKNLRYD
jgi:glyoxylase-like metal-dependent hydrolase (beta-lactamase superfamily II)